MNSLPKSFLEIRRQNKRRTRLGLALLAAALASAVLSLCLGPVALSPGQVVSALLGREPGSIQWRIVYYARLPRTCGCLLAGAALAVAGAVIQSVLDNPLAAPNVIGVNAGAGLAVTAGSALFPGAVALVPVWAFAGAMAGVFLVLFIGEKTGASRLTLVLAGIAVSAVFNGAVELLLTLSPDALSAYADFRIGGFSGVSLRRVAPAGLATGAGLLAALLLAPKMEVLALGAETAQSLGLRVRPVRGALLTAAAALAGAAVSIAGLLGFVGLIVPHATRWASGGEGRSWIIFSALGGAAGVTLCDLLARCILAPYELPAGVVLSFLGGPFFLWRILGRNRGGRRDA